MAFGITGHPKQVIVVLKGKRLEASLIDVAGARRLAIGVPSLGGRQGQPADKLRQFCILPRPHDQMPVMAHHTVRQRPRLRPGDRFDEDVFESLVIGVFLENRQAGVRAIQDVINATPPRLLVEVVPCRPITNWSQCLSQAQPDLRNCCITRPTTAAART